MSRDKESLSPIEYAGQLAQLVVRVMGQKGVAAGYIQCFDPTPERAGEANEFSEQRLDRDAARQLMAQKAGDGFMGIMAFACFEESVPQVWAEGFDTRPDNARTPETARTVAVSLPLKKNWRGQLKSAVQGVVIEGSAQQLVFSGQLTTTQDLKTRLEKNRADAAQTPGRSS